MAEVQPLGKFNSKLIQSAAKDGMDIVDEDEVPLLMESDGKMLLPLVQGAGDGSSLTSRTQWHQAHTRTVTYKASDRRLDMLPPGPPGRPVCFRDGRRQAAVVTANAF